MIAFLFHDISYANITQVPFASESTSATGKQYRSYIKLSNETSK